MCLLTRLELVEEGSCSCKAGVPCPLVPGAPLDVHSDAYQGQNKAWRSRHSSYAILYDLPAGYVAKPNIRGKPGTVAQLCKTLK